MTPRDTSGRFSGDWLRGAIDQKLGRSSNRVRTTDEQSVGGKWLREKIDESLTGPAKLGEAPPAEQVATPSTPAEQAAAAGGLGGGATEHESGGSGESFADRLRREGLGG